MAAFLTRSRSWARRDGTDGCAGEAKPLRAERPGEGLLLAAELRRAVPELRRELELRREDEVERRFVAGFNLDPDQAECW
jgi:hypothetical protein